MVAQVREEAGLFSLHGVIGGAAEVWRATDRRTARTVAMKLLAERVAEDDAARSRFQQMRTIDAVTSTITGTVHVAPGASMVAFSPDGTRAWVSSRDSSVMTTFLTAS